MDSSLFLAKVFGIYFLVMGVGFLIHPRWFRESFTALVKTRAAFFIISIVIFILGILLVTTHNLWVKDWRVVITVLSWLVFIKGILGIIAPHDSEKVAQHFFKHRSTYYIAGVIFLVLGLFLGFHGFF